MTQPNPNETLSDTERVGIADAVLTAYDAIDRSDLPDEKKRNLLFSVYSFRCLFDNKEMTYIHPILKKYACTFSCALKKHPLYPKHRAEFEQVAFDKTTAIPYGGLYVKDGADYVVRFDAGSPVWQELKRSGKLSGIDTTIPEKFDLYQMTYEIISLNTADTGLKALWYLTFPYAMLLGAPHNPDLYEILFETLARREIFRAVIESPHSIYVRDSENELRAEEGIPAPAVAWYLPYLAYKNEKDEAGASREEKRFQAWLGAGKFYEVYAGTEKLLDTFPFDDGLLICNIASRISLHPAATDDTVRQNLLKETLALIESALQRGSEKKLFLLYYAGLAHLGLHNKEAALYNFIACTELNPNFQPAKVMIKAITG